MIINGIREFLGLVYEMHTDPLLLKINITLPCSLLFRSGVAELSFVGKMNTVVVYSHMPTFLDSACV